MNNIQETIDKLISIISDSGLRPKVKELGLSLIKNLCTEINIREKEINQLQAKKYGLKKEVDFVNYVDKCIAFSELLGVSDIAINEFKEEDYIFIIHNITSLKKPTNYESIQVLINCLEIYRIFNNNENPINFSDLISWLTENEYIDKLKEIHEVIKLKYTEINANI